MPPPRRRRPDRRKLIHALARAGGWMTALGTITVLGYIIKTWPHKAGAVSAGIVGSTIALLNDSWETIAHLDFTGHFPPLPPPRAVLHDMLGLAVCLGGLMMLLFSDIREQRDMHYVYNAEKRVMMTTSQWFLAAVALWRFVFAIWSGCFCARRTDPSGRLTRRQLRHEGLI